MKCALLILSLALSLVAQGLAIEPYKIPKAKEVKIDGEGTEWPGNASFYVGDLLSKTGRPVDAADCSTGMRLAWDAEGLIAAFHVRDDSASEVAQAMYLADSLELFVGTEVGSKNRYQLVIGPGADPKHAELRTFLNDQRLEKEPPLSVEVARQVFEGGYFLEVRLPWKNLGIQAQPGTKIAFQAMINDLDAGETRFRAAWFPGEDTSTNAQQMYTLELVEGESTNLPAQVRSERLGAEIILRVACNTVTGTERVVSFRNAADEEVARVVVPGSGTTAGALYTPGADMASELTVTLDGQAFTTLALAPSGGLTKRDLSRPNYTLVPSVFSGDAFPALQLKERDKVEARLGPVSTSFRYFDAQMNEVQAPTAPGRYGVEMTVTTLSGEVTVRQQTLFKTPAKVNWNVEKLSFGNPLLPPSLGIDPMVAGEHANHIADEFADEFKDQLGQSVWHGVLLAGLYEQKSLGRPAGYLEAPWRADADWWVRFMKKTGTLPVYDRMVYLPKEYEADKEKKWPLVLFLHGSGDGDTPEVLKKWGPPKEVSKGREFPFIMVAPRSEPGQWMWWHPGRLSDLLDEIEQTYRVDKDRIYVTGLSMGGYGTWYLAAEYPDRFAAIAPFCGGGEPDTAPRFAKLPVWAFHGEVDESVPVERTREMITALQAAGGQPKVTYYPGVGHNCWDEPYMGTEVYEWLLSHKRGE